MQGAAICRYVRICGGRIQLRRKRGGCAADRVPVNGKMGVS